MEIVEHMNMQGHNDENRARQHETFDTSHSFLNMKYERTCWGNTHACSDANMLSAERKLRYRQLSQYYDLIILLSYSSSSFWFFGKFDCQDCRFAVYNQFIYYNRNNQRKAM